MMECYIKTVEEHLWKVIASHQRDWDTRLPIFLLAYRASAHDTTGLNSASLLFGRELRLPWNLVFGASPRQRTTHSQSCRKFSGPPIWHPQLCQHLKLASNQMKTCYDILANCTGYQEGDNVWLYCPTHTKGKSPKLPAILMGGPVQGNHPDKRCGIQDPVEL
jgi:hypothetical protein